MSSKLALLIDVDQTLVTQEQPFVSAVAKVLQELGRTDINPGKREFNEQLDLHSEYTPELVVKTRASRRDVLWITPDENRSDEAAIVDWVSKTRLSVWAAILGETDPKSSVTKSAAELMAATVPELIAPMPGAFEAMALIPEHVKIVAVTNGFASHQLRKLKQTNLLNRLDGVVTSADAGSSKPSPEPFLMALEMAGVSAVDAVMIGDSLTNDVDGAASLGIKAVQVSGELESGSESTANDHLPNVYDAITDALNM